MILRSGRRRRGRDWTTGEVQASRQLRSSWRLSAAGLPFHPSPVASKEARPSCRWRTGVSSTGCRIPSGEGTCAPWPGMPSCVQAEESGTGDADEPSGPFPRISGEGFLPPTATPLLFGHHARAWMNDGRVPASQGRHCCRRREDDCGSGRLPHALVIARGGVAGQR